MPRVRVVTDAVVQEEVPFLTAIPTDKRGSALAEVVAEAQPRTATRASTSPGETVARVRTEAEVVEELVVAITEALGAVEGEAIGAMRETGASAVVVLGKAWATPAVRGRLAGMAAPLKMSHRVAEAARWEAQFSAIAAR